jgi:hypothetical protein
LEGKRDRLLLRGSVTVDLATMRQAPTFGILDTPTLLLFRPFDRGPTLDTDIHTAHRTVADPLNRGAPSAAGLFR